MKKALRVYLQPQTALMGPMINKPFPAPDFNIRIPIVILTKGKGFINQGSTLLELQFQGQLQEASYHVRTIYVPYVIQHGPYVSYCQ